MLYTINNTIETYMKLILLILLFISYGSTSCQTKPSTKLISYKTETAQKDFLWLKLADSDSVKFKGYSIKVYNQGRDSVLFAHYITKLYKSKKDVENLLFKKQSILVLEALALKTNLPDTMFVQAKGLKKESVIRKSTDFNIMAVFNKNEWQIKDGQV
ncbi:hypothetical protein [uncultured Lacinutrix sp.]|uniref:hypothetical protein n=1 Tax=uncultured Lacinutrix sp. TaxID=574032 RepID=UPI00260794C8|nr:hypothetical protein [uncultured Lacinutrix sp.]